MTEPTKIVNHTNDQVADTNVNNVNTKRNPTMLDQIRGNFEETSYGRSMSQ